MNRLEINVQTGEQAIVALTQEEIDALPVWTAAECKARLSGDLRYRRDLAMNVLDGLQSDALSVGDTIAALAIKDAKQACRDIPSFDVSNATDEAGVRALYLSEWRRITLLVPAGVRVSFVSALA